MGIVKIIAFKGGEITTGEHWDSKTGQELDKKKDQYVRIQWVVPKEKTITTIITKEGLARDPTLENDLLRWYATATKEKIKEGSCVISKIPIGIKDVYIHFEFYNWEKPKTERDFDVAFNTIRNDLVRAKLDTLKTLGKNPTFLPTINCDSFGICGSHKPSKLKQLNCGHIALRFSVIHRQLNDKSGKIDLAPQLYCKRAHPQILGLPTEKDINWDVATAGTAIMLSNIEQTLKRVKTEIKKNPKLLENARQKYIDEIFMFEKKIGVSLNLLPADAKPSGLPILI